MLAGYRFYFSISCQASGFDHRKSIVCSLLSHLFFITLQALISTPTGTDGKTGTDEKEANQLEDGNYCQNGIDDDGDGLIGNPDSSFSFFYPQGTAEGGSIYLNR